MRQRLCVESVSVYAWKNRKFSKLSVSVYAWKTREIHRLIVENESVSVYALHFL